MAYNSTERADPDSLILQNISVLHIGHFIFFSHLFGQYMVQPNGKHINRAQLNPLPDNLGQVKLLNGQIDFGKDFHFLILCVEIC